MDEYTDCGKKQNKYGESIGRNGQEKMATIKKMSNFYSASPQLCPFGDDEKEGRVVRREGKETERGKCSVQWEEESRWEEVQRKKKKQNKTERDEKVENKKERSRRRAEEDGERCGAEWRGDIWWPEAICGDIFTPLLISNARTMCTGSFVTAFLTSLLPLLLWHLLPLLCLFVVSFLGAGKPIFSIFTQKEEEEKSLNCLIGQWCHGFGSNIVLRGNYTTWPHLKYLQNTLYLLFLIICLNFFVFFNFKAAKKRHYWDILCTKGRRRRRRRSIKYAESLLNIFSQP